MTVSYKHAFYLFYLSQKSYRNIWKRMSFCRFLIHVFYKYKNNESLCSRIMENNHSREQKKYLLKL